MKKLSHTCEETEALSPFSKPMVFLYRGANSLLFGYDCFGIQQPGTCISCEAIQLFLKHCKYLSALTNIEKFRCFKVGGGGLSK